MNVEDMDNHKDKEFLKDNINSSKENPINIISNYKSTEELEKEVIELQRNYDTILNKQNKLEAKLNHELKIILLNQKTIIGQLDILTKRNSNTITQPIFPFLSGDPTSNLRDRNWHIRKKEAYKFIPETSNTNLD